MRTAAAPASDCASRTRTSLRIETRWLRGQRRQVACRWNWCRSDQRAELGFAAMLGVTEEPPSQLTAQVVKRVQGAWQLSPTNKKAVTPPGRDCFNKRVAEGKTWEPRVSTSGRLKRRHNSTRRSPFAAFQYRGYAQDFGNKPAIRTLLAIRSRVQLVRIAQRK
jgi:hypothetical protein